MPYTRQEFLKSIRNKYPQYDNWDDDKLYNSLLDKYPVYKDQIIQESPEKLKVPEMKPGYDRLAKTESAVVESTKQPHRFPRPEPSFQVAEKVGGKELTPKDVGKAQAQLALQRYTESLRRQPKEKFGSPAQIFIESMIDELPAGLLGRVLGNVPRHVAAKRNVAKEKYPIESQIGGAAGSVLSFMTTTGALNATGVLSKPALAAIGSTKYPRLTRGVARGASGALSFGTYSAIRDAVPYVEKGEPLDLEYAENVGKSMMLGTGLGWTAGFKPAPAAAGSFAIGTAYGKISGQDNIDALTTGAMYTVFSLLGNKRAREHDKAVAYRQAVNTMSKKIQSSDIAMEKFGKKNIEKISKAVVDQAIKQTGGIEKLSSAKFDRFINKVNNNIEFINQKGAVSINKLQEILPKDVRPPSKIPLTPKVAQTQAAKPPIKPTETLVTEPKVADAGKISQAEQELLKSDEILPKDVRPAEKISLEGEKPEAQKGEKQTLADTDLLAEAKIEVQRTAKDYGITGDNPAIKLSDGTIAVEEGVGYGFYLEGNKIPINKIKQNQIKEAVDLFEQRNLSINPDKVSEYEKKYGGNIIGSEYKLGRENFIVPPLKDFITNEMFWYKSGHIKHSINDLKFIHKQAVKTALENNSPIYEGWENDFPDIKVQYNKLLNDKKIKPAKTIDIKKVYIHTAKPEAQVKQSLITEKPDAKYIGAQKRPDGTELPLFNITKEGHPQKGSTVSEKTLTKLGLKVPEQAQIGEKPVVEKQAKTLKSDVEKLSSRYHILERELKIPQDRIKEIKREIAGKETLSGATSEQMVEYIDKIRQEKKIKNKEIISVETESRIEELKTNLIEQGKLTEDKFGKVLNDIGLKTYGFVDKNNFISEKQGKDLLITINESIPIIQQEMKLESALKEAPAIDNELKRTEKIFESKREERPRIKRVHKFLDMEHFTNLMEKQSGKPIGRAWERLNNKRHDAERNKADVMIGEIVQSPDYHKVANSVESIERIEDYIASKLSDIIENKPGYPTDITENERLLADKVIAGLDSFKDDVRYQRVKEWIKTNGKEEIPNAPEADLIEARKIYETWGNDALKDYLGSKEWGVTTSGYYIGEFKKIGIDISPKKPSLSKAHLKTKKSREYKRGKRTIFDRYFSYVRTKTLSIELEDDLSAFEQLWKNNAETWGNYDEIQKLLERNKTDMLHKTTDMGQIEHFAARMSSQAARALFLDIRKGVRNLFQNAAYYTDLLPELVKAGKFVRAGDLRKVAKSIRKSQEGIDKAIKDNALVKTGLLTNEDLGYFNTYVSQLGSIHRDLMMLQHGSKLPGIKQLNEIADAIDIMGRTDTMNRLIAYTTKINVVRNALKKYPNATTDINQLRRMMKSAGMGSLTSMERKHAQEILAMDGKDAFARHVAKQTTAKYHYRYDRAERSPEEQGSFARRLLSNLFVFKKGALQRLSLDVKKLSKTEREIGKGTGSTAKAIRSLVQMTVVSTLIGKYLYQRLTNDRRNPYSPIEIMKSLNIGGLPLASQEMVGTIVGDFIGAVTGDEKAFARATATIPRASNMFIPLYDEIINTIEAVTDQKYIDRKALRRLRELVDKEYELREDYYKKERNIYEKLNHAILGTEKEEKPKPKEIKFY